MKKGQGKTREPGQTELFPPASGARDTTPPSPSSEPAAAKASDERLEALEVLLTLCGPVRAGSASAAFLKSRRIFKRTWEAAGLRHVDNYRATSNALSERFGSDRLAGWGLFNREGHLRFYRHTLLVPWRDKGNAAWLQAFSTDPHASPAELSVSGPPPCPYNARLLDGTSGRLYLCAGPLDALALIEAGFPAVAAAGDGLLRPGWLKRFRGKSVYVAYDADVDGEAAAAKALGALTGAGIEAHRLAVPAGREVGEWLAGK